MKGGGTIAPLPLMVPRALSDSVGVGTWQKVAMKLLWENVKPRKKGDLFQIFLFLLLNGTNYTMEKIGTWKISNWRERSLFSDTLSHNFYELYNSAVIKLIFSLSIDTCK